VVAKSKMVKNAKIKTWRSSKLLEVRAAMKMMIFGKHRILPPMTMMPLAVRKVKLARVSVTILIVALANGPIGKT
jgi:hypothetical protein